MNLAQRPVTETAFRDIAEIDDLRGLAALGKLGLRATFQQKGRQERHFVYKKRRGKEGGKAVCGAGMV